MSAWRSMVWVLLLLVAAGLVAIQMRREGGRPSSDGIARPSEQSGNSTNLTLPGTQSTTETGAAATSPGNTELPVDPEFKKWLAAEARELDSLNVDSASKESAIKTVVAKLTPQQSKQLLQTAKNPNAPAGEKILSTYLLVEAGVRSLGDLRELIVSPVPDGGPHPAHSEGELKGIREKSLRIMAVDGLVSRAKNEPEARAALARAIEDIQDPYIKAYAEDRFRQLDAN